MVRKTIELPADWEGKEEITTETRKLARQLALVYYSFAKSILEEMGEEKGTKLVKRILKEIAVERGEAMRAEASKQGLPFTLESMWKVNDLPKYTFPMHGHEGEFCCPYADLWKEKGELGQKLGLLWCNIIDPWKVRIFIGPSYKLWKYGKNLNLKNDYCGEPIPLTEKEAEEQKRL